MSKSVRNKGEETDNSSLLKDLELEGLADWRVESFGRLANDLPAAFPGGPSHPTGSFVYPAPTLVRYPTYNAIGFITPSPTAMALNIAATAAAAAVVLRTQILFQNGVSPIGSVKMVTDKSQPILFDYFEQCMIAVAFSFQSLEAFSNQVIQAHVKETFRVLRKGESKDLSADDLERETPTEEKLATVLPSLLSVKSPKGQKVWERFVKLKRVRDSAIHLKSVDAQSRLDTESLYFQFLNHNAKDFPRAALEMIEHFRADTKRPLWMARIQERVKET
jgi:hypothetical protein